MLGCFEVLRDGEPIPEEAWGRRKTKTMLKVLLTKPGHVFTQDQLIEALFEGENPRNAVNNLYSRVSELRRALEPGLKRGTDSKFILRRGQGYCFEVDSPCWIDTAEFLKHFAQGEEHHESGQHAEAIHEYEEAIRLYRGELSEDDRYEQWALEPRDEWQERCISALIHQSEDYAHLEDCHQAATACRQAFDIQPWRESVLRQLMTYQQMAGERSEALRAYQKGVDALKLELDVEPSEETKALHERILEEVQSVEQAVYDKRRIAVLPMVNISPDPEDEYFADGMTEELIFTLSKIHELKVIAQTSALSYKNTKKTIAQIGQELSIGTVLEGSVRRARDAVRITVQLIDVESEEHLWSEEYDRPLQDIFAIQSDVAQQVAEALRVRLADSLAQSMTIAPTQNLEAYTLYLKGRCSLVKKKRAAIEQAREYFNRAIELDPEFALAHAGLSDAFFHMVDYNFLSPEVGHPLAKSAAERAVEIEPTCRTALLLLATLLVVQDGEMSAGEVAFRSLVALHPGYASAHRVFGLVLLYRGDLDEATKEIQLAVQLDPHDIVAQRNYGEALGAAGQFDEAIETLQAVLELDPQASRVHQSLGDFFYMKGMYEEALAEFNKETAYSAPSRIGCVYAAMGRLDEAREILEQMAERSEREYINLASLARLAFAIGEADMGFEYLEEAYRSGTSVVLLSLKTSPWFDSVRSDPRFVSLMQRIGIESSE